MWRFVGTAALLLLATVVVADTVIEEDDEGLTTTEIPFVESTSNMDRIVVICSEDRMEIHVRKDLDLFWLEGPEPECKPTYGEFVEYDGSKIQVKNWSLPLVESDKPGPCGIRFVPVENSTHNLWAHQVTLYEEARPRERIMQCLKVGVLDKRGARILIEQITPEIKPLFPVDGTIEVIRRSMLSAFFEHRFPAEANLYLHPIRCYIVNDRQATRKMIVADGCPTLLGPRKIAYANLGSTTADGVTGEDAHVYFNADPKMFPDEDPNDLPTFRLQCDVMPCKADLLYEQVIGVPRCPSIANCQENKTAYVGIKETFEINQEFSLTVSNTSSIDPALYRLLGRDVYPGNYAWLDYIERHEKASPGKASWSWCTWTALVGGVLAALAAAAYVGFVCLRRQQNELFSREVRLNMTAGLVYPVGTKNSVDPLFDPDETVSYSDDVSFGNYDDYRPPFRSIDQVD